MEGFYILAAGILGGFIGGFTNIYIRKKLKKEEIIRNEKKQAFVELLTSIGKTKKEINDEGAQYSAQIDLAVAEAKCALFGAKSVTDLTKKFKNDLNSNENIIDELLLAMQKELDKKGQ